MAARITWPQALAWRMERQFLDPLGGASVVDVARRLCGVQAQVASSAEIAIRVRQANPRDGEVAQALADGRLIKTWAMRGTLHLLPADEAAVYLAVLASSRMWEAPRWERWFGLSPSQVEGLRDIVREILDGRALTREDVNAEIVTRPGYEHLGDALKSGWGTLFKPLAWQGDICFGPQRGTRVTFARPEQLSADWRPLMDADDAARLAIISYVGAYGPTTPTQVGAWLSRGLIPRRRLKQYFSDLGESLASVDVEGEAMFVRGEDVNALATTRPNTTVRLLGGFEQWVLGPGTDDVHVIPAGRRSAVSRTSGWIAPIAIVGGVVSGTWAIDDDQVRLEWFAECGSPPTAALESEVARLSRLLDRSLSLSLRTVRLA
jgi:hypothetical protein